MQDPQQLPSGSRAFDVFVICGRSPVQPVTQNAILALISTSSNGRCSTTNLLHATIHRFIVVSRRLPCQLLANMSLSKVFCSASTEIVAPSPFKTSPLDLPTSQALLQSRLCLQNRSNLIGMQRERGDVLDMKMMVMIANRVPRRRHRKQLNNIVVFLIFGNQSSLLSDLYNRPTILQH